MSHIINAERRALHHAVLGSLNNQGGGGSTVTAESLTRQLQTFVQLSSQVESLNRKWASGVSLLSPAVIRSQFPNTWKLCVEDNLQVGRDEPVALKRPWRFAWPLELNSNLSHLVTFGKSVIEEWAKTKGIDWTAAVPEA
jgi:hypothetical protein